MKKNLQTRSYGKTKREKSKCFGECDADVSVLQIICLSQ